jgi:hypothetical protein
VGRRGGSKENEFKFQSFTFSSFSSFALRFFLLRESIQFIELPRGRRKGIEIYSRFGVFEISKYLLDNNHPPDELSTPCTEIFI